jgi:hypothetical protein
MEPKTTETKQRRGFLKSTLAGVFGFFAFKTGDSEAAPRLGRPRPRPRPAGEPKRSDPLKHSFAVIDGDGYLVEDGSTETEALAYGADVIAGSCEDGWEETTDRISVFFQTHETVQVNRSEATPDELEDNPGVSYYCDYVLRETPEYSRLKKIIAERDELLQFMKTEPCPPPAVPTYERYKSEYDKALRDAVEQGTPEPDDGLFGVS